MGFMVGSIVAGIVGVATGLFNVNAGFNGFIQGMTNLISVPFILIMAWSMGSVTSTMGVGTYLAGIVEAHLTAGLVRPSYLHSERDLICNPVLHGVYGLS